jgi:hypothetical protein
MLPKMFDNHSISFKKAKHLLTKGATPPVEEYLPVGPTRVIGFSLPALATRISR